MGAEPPSRRGGEALAGVRGTPPGVAEPPASVRPPPKPFWRSGTALIFGALVLGVLMGGFLPADQHPIWFAFFQFCSKGFLALIKGIIVPLLVSTIITGIAQT